MEINNILLELKPLLNNNKKELFDRLVSGRLVKSLESYAKDLVDEVNSSEMMLDTVERTRKVLRKINKKEK